MPTFGDTSAGGSTFPANSGRVFISKFTLTEAGTVTTIYQYFDGASGSDSWKGLIYSDLAGSPSALLASSAGQLQTAGTGWNSASISAVLSPGDYWLGCVCDGFGSSVGTDASGSMTIDYGGSYASPPNPWTSSSTNATQLNVYAEYTTASGVRIAWVRA